MDNIEKQPTLNCVRPAPTGQDSDPNESMEKPTKSGAVPRKVSNKETYEPLGSCSKHEIDEDIMAPLGFEPEGSAAKPSFSEGCSSLQGLLSDRNSYGVFYEYLRQEKHESLLDFLRSCEEFRLLAKTGSNLATRSANATYSNYMHKRQLCGEILQDSIRARVKHKLNSGQPLSESTFDSAQEAIVAYINEYHYIKFIRSDVYKRCIGESVKNSTKDRRNMGRFVGPALEPLPEEKVLAFDGEHQHGHWMCYDTKPRSHGRPIDGEREGYLLQSQNLSKAALAGMFCQPAPVVSVNDSDVQSLSSDALTDDSKSTVTDFSDLTSKSAEKRSGPVLRDMHGFVPRTKRMPKGSKQLPPDEFAKLLCVKLEKVKLQREQEERAAINLSSSTRENCKENRREKSILEDAAERHRQYQQARKFGLGLPLPKFTEPSYPISGNSSIISSSSHASYIEPCQVPCGYYSNTEHTDGANWRGCMSENVLEKPQHVPLVNTKKQWESVRTIESAPDSGVSMEEDHNLPPDQRNRILQWMEDGEKEVQTQQIQHSRFIKNTRTKHPVVYNAGHIGLTEQGVQNLRPIVQDPCMPPLSQPDPRNTIEEVSRRLSQKNSREKRSKMHHKSRPGYMSNRPSQMACPKFSGDSADCSSVISGDHVPATRYSSSSVLSSVPSTTNSIDSGVGCVQKKDKGTRIVYYLPGEDDIPYQSSLPGQVILLGQFKDLINFKKGNYRYFVYKETDDKDVVAVFEEVKDDAAALPCFGNKIICKVKQA